MKMALLPSLVVIFGFLLLSASVLYGRDEDASHMTSRSPRSSRRLEELFPPLSPPVLRKDTVFECAYFSATLPKGWRVVVFEPEKENRKDSVHSASLTAIWTSNRSEIQSPIPSAELRLLSNLKKIPQQTVEYWKHHYASVNIEAIHKIVLTISEKELTWVVSEYEYMNEMNEPAIRWVGTGVGEDDLSSSYTIVLSCQIEKKSICRENLNFLLRKFRAKKPVSTVLK